MKRLFCLFILLLVAATVSALEMPEHPSGRVSDYANILSSGDVSALDAKLQGIEEQTSNQIAIAIFPQLGDEDVDDFTNRLFEKWHLGQKQRNNGVLMTVFVQDHKVR